jgi:hypothetical protein
MAKKKESFSLQAFWNGFFNIRNSYIVYYLIKRFISTLLNIDVYIAYPWKKIEVKCII